jgi:hypothetical protein
MVTSAVYAKDLGPMMMAVAIIMKVQRHILSEDLLKFFTITGASFLFDR